MADLLNFAIEHGMIDTSYVQEQIEMRTDAKKEEILSNLPEFRDAELVF